MIFDKANGLNVIERLKLVRELAEIKQSLLVEMKTALERLKFISRANQIRVLLTGVYGSDTPSANRDSGVYGHQDIKSRGKRQKANKAAVDIVTRFKTGELSQSDLTEEDRETLAAYSGNGGALIGEDGKKGSAYEYYTPTPVAAGVWDALKDMGFAGGKVLDPSAGTGVFGATAPGNAAVDAVELDGTSGSINALLNNSDTYTTTISPFEAVAAATPDEQYDAVVTNVPFGTTADRGGNQLLDKKYQKDTLETYFILRSLDKLKPGGLAAFIVPPRCTTARGGSDRKLRERASLKAEFLGAYRLPNKVFGAAAADTITDVIFFRKFGADSAVIISELMEQNPVLLSDAKVLWSDYIDGDYFKTPEGSPHVLGDFKAKDPEKYRDVDRVENNASVPEIANLLRKLPDSRIDWGLLESAETMPIEYRDGDTLAHGGQTLEYRNGDWITLDSSSSDLDMMQLLGRCKDAYSAFESDVTLKEAIKLVDYMHATSQSLFIPGWLASINSALDFLSSPDKKRSWRPVLVGAAVRQILDEVGRSSGTNFLQEYPELSKAMLAHHTEAKRLKLKGFGRQVLGEIRNHYKGKKQGYSALWRGDVAESAPVIESIEMGIDGIQYQNKSHWLSLEQARSVMGGAFDPVESDEWCISDDGTQCTPADDYYVGNYQAFLTAIDTAVSSSSDDRVKSKLLRQKTLAAERVDKVNLERIQFNLFSPYVGMEEKAEFLRRYVDSRAVVGTNERTGDQEIIFDIRGSKLTDYEKLLKRFGYHLKTGSVSLGGAELSIDDKAAIKQLRDMLKRANEQFNSWSKSSPKVLSRLEKQMSDPAKLRFRQADDETPLQVPGLHPDFKPHGYQSSWTRKIGRDFAGINAFGTGLGKTFSALMAVQYVQSMGVKKKTIFVVPNSVLSNWHKEAVRGDPEKGDSPAYASNKGCLFVGLREKGSGKFDVDSSLYDEDLNIILENQHSKIFMTFEAFERIPLRDDSIEGFERYMRTVDASFADSESKKEDERKKGKAKTILSILSGKGSAAPYLEDMGVDSIVIDEAHGFKNSSSTVDFSGAKYLSISEPAKRGLDAQAKCWYIRGLSAAGDGVIPLTATPLTNSPLEIYSMLALAYGHERVNDMMGGISGADDFMFAVCDIEDEDQETIDGKYRSMRVFKGLNNVDMLRSMLHQVATVKSSEDVGNQIHVPDAQETATSVELSESTNERLQLYKDAYRYAADTMREKDDAGGSEHAYTEVSEYFCEPMELVAHPFNLINKMTLLVIDPDLDRRMTRYHVANEDMATKLAEEWNRKKPSEERDRPGPNATEDEATSVKARRIDGEVVGRLYKIPVKAWQNGSSVCIDSMDWKTQDKLEAMAKKLKIELDVSVPPKLAAFLDNFQREAASPRGVDAEGKRVSRAKQIVFCDILSMHNKIKRLLVSRAGLSSSRIVIATGQRNSSPEAIQAVQDGFNGTGNDGKFDVVIGNQKIEVGINLQKGTQALHHLTIGWTPDSLTQRNGRGVRQGNATSNVTVYHYDASGTFDSAKRTLVNSKSNWIDSLMDQSGKDDRIEISGGMSREKMEALIDVMGDRDGESKLQESQAAQEAEDRAKSKRDKQIINLDTIQKQRQFLSDYEQPVSWVGKYLGELMGVMGARASLRERLANPKVGANAAARYESKLAELQLRLDGLNATINAGATIFKTDYQGNNPVQHEPEEVISEFLRGAKRGESRPSDLIKAISAGHFAYSTWRIDVNEDSELYSDWSSEIDMSEAMKEQSVINYEKQAGGDRSLPEEAARALAAGQGALIKGLPVFDGCLFVSDNASDLVVYHQGKAHGRWGGSLRFEERKVWMMAEGEIIYPGTARYSELLVEAAKLEDQAEEEGEPFNGYSDAIPDVLQHRVVEKMAVYSIGKWRLPSPYFPVVIPDYHGRDSEHLAKIIKQQSGVIKRFNSYPAQFVVSSSVEVEPIGALTAASALLDYYKANGIRAKVADFGPDEYRVVRDLVHPLVSADSLRAKLETVEATSVAVDAAVSEYFEDSVPWFDVGGDIENVMTWDMKYVINEILSVTSKSAESDDDYIKVVGETKMWKEQIKSYARRYGGGFKWLRNEVAWEIKRGAFKLLIEEYSRAGEDLSIR